MMDEERDQRVEEIELHEEFLQHVERGGGKIMALSLVTVAVAALLAASYVSQLVVLPFMMGVTAQTVDLTDPALMASEAALLILTLVWAYIGARDYAFSRRVVRQVKEIREAQAEAAGKHGLET